MGHIINLVNFLIEITFGRQPSRRSGKRTIFFLIVTMVLAGSIAGNLLLFREVYDLTAKDIASRRELTRLFSVEKERDEFRAKYDGLLAVLRGAEDLPTAPVVAKPAEKPVPQKKPPRQREQPYPGPERPNTKKPVPRSEARDGQ